jgi:hypothetical protein
MLTAETHKIMLIPFNQISSAARVWVYQSAQPIPAEVQALSEQFVEGWTAHNQMLKASAQVLFDHFLILAVDESAMQASGCSIDKSVHFVQSLENQFGLHFFERLKTAFREKEKLVFRTRSQIREAIAAGDFEENTLIFNNLIQTVGELKTHWQIPAKNSWLKDLFVKENV